MNAELADLYAADQADHRSGHRYGTPAYVAMRTGDRQRLWDVAPGTTDEERAAWDVPPLAEQLRKAEEATPRDPPGPDDAPGWLKAALARWYPET